MNVKKKVLAAGAALLAALAALAAGCGDGEGGDGGGGSGGGGGSAPSCADYCETVMMNCTADHAVYASKDVCLKACTFLPAGTAADTTGNTLGCRSYHATAAAMDPATHCPHAGPGGAGYCGTNCEGYCNLAQGVCSTYTSESDCLTVCKGFTDTEPFSALDTTGDTVQCRLYHASVAAGDKTHCAHIGTSPPAGTCTDM